MAGKLILRHRFAIGIALLAITAVFGYYASRVAIGTSFVNFFPKNHPYIKLYHDTKRYGGAQTLTLMLRVKRGDIFNNDILKTIQDLTFAVDRLPAVHHQSIRSLASYRVEYAITAPGSLAYQPFMYPNVPQTPGDIGELKREVFVHRHELTNLVSADDRSAAITCSFDEGRLDYHSLFNNVQKIIKRYQGPNTIIYAAGEPITRGYGYYYLPLLVMIFVISDGLMILILYVFFKGRNTWWAPIVTGLLSTVWGFGFIGMMGYEFDPVMIVIRFILTARDMSHGIQWQGRYYDELEARNYDKISAIEATTEMMLPPGLLSILADIAGIVFISFGGIPALQEVASSGAVWLAGSLTMVFIFQPIMMSYLPTPSPLAAAGKRRTIRRHARRGLAERLIGFPTTPGFARGGALVLVGVLIVGGFVAGLQAKIGYSEPGTPLYRHNAKVNRDIQAIGKVFPLDEGWVIVRAKTDPNVILDPDVLQLEEDLINYLREDAKVVQVVGVVDDIVEPFNEMFHYAVPKFRSLPVTQSEASFLWLLFAQGTAPGEAAQWQDDMHGDTVLRVLLTDHTYGTLNTLQARLRRFVQQRQAWDPALSKVSVLYLSGLAGLYAAANDVLATVDFLNITFVLAVVFILCAIEYRSIVAGVLFVVACIAANFAAFIFMRLADIGITIDTIPVISLGIGLGVDYGIYTVSRILDECAAGNRLEDAITRSLRGTGAAVLATFLVIVAGLAPWLLSPVLFHHEMTELLIIVMFTNLIMGLLILPAYIAWAQPAFVFRDLSEKERVNEKLTRVRA